MDLDVWIAHSPHFRILPNLHKEISPENKQASLEVKVSHIPAVQRQNKGISKRENPSRARTLTHEAIRETAGKWSNPNPKAPDQTQLQPSARDRRSASI